MKTTRDQQKRRLFKISSLGEYKLVSQGIIKLVGMPIVIRSSQPEKYAIIRNAWKNFNKNVWRLSNRMGSDQWLKFGVAFDSCKGKHYTYMPAVAVDSLLTIPEGMTGKEIQPLQYAVFTHKGSIEYLKQTVFRIYSQWLPNLTHEVMPATICGINHFERYDRRFNWLDPATEVEVYVPIKSRD